METLKFKAVIDSDYFNLPPNLKIHYDGNVIADFPVVKETIIEKEITVEDDKEYKLNFTLYNKSKYDTVVEDGKIIKDTVVKIKQVELDDVDITHMLPTDQEKFYYKHDSGQVDAFYDTMGVNGTSTVKFTTPFYVWLLETL